MSAGELEQQAQLEMQLEELRSENRRLLRRMSKKEDEAARRDQAIYQAFKDGIMTLPPLESVTPYAEGRRFEGKKHEEEVAVLDLSDWQLGKRTPDYNSEVCAERIRKLADKVIELTEIQRKDHPIKTIHNRWIGDIVEGEMIFPGQEYRIDASLYDQIFRAMDIGADLINRLRPAFALQHNPAVQGNHGAIGGPFRRSYNPETNADRMVYRFLAKRFEHETSITWTYPEEKGERNWWITDKIGDHTTLMVHGDQFRGGFAGFPWYGVAKKVWSWKSGGLRDASNRQVYFDDVDFGHWHQPVLMPLNFTTARCNGSTESTNTYAMEELAAAGRPSQWLYFVHPSRGVTAEYRIWLDD